MPSISESFNSPRLTKTNMWNNSSMPFPGWSWNETSTGLQGSRSRLSTVTPMFADRKRTGKLPENTFRFSETTYTDLNGTSLQEVSDGSGGITWVKRVGAIGPLGHTGSEPWSGAFLSALFSNQSNLIRARLANKVRDTSIDMSVFAGEARETNAMFLDLAKRLNTAIRAARRGDAQTAAAALSLRNSKDWANLWLMISYGIRPFVSDVYGAAKALETGLMEEKFSRVNSRDLFTDSRTTVTGSAGSGYTTTVWDLKYEISGRVKYYVQDPYVSTLTSLGLTTPLGTAWELTKLSFVIDWALGIGSWLSQLGTYFGKEFETGGETGFLRIEGKSTFVRNSHASGVKYTVHGSSSYQRVVCERVGFTSFPVAYAPAFKDPLSTFTVLSGMSLIRQSFK